jgi:CheY-like chemotaxis protein
MGRRAQRNENGSERDADRSTAGPQAAGSTPRQVLVVDDEAGLRDMLAQILSEEGYRVVVADHGRSAIDAIRNELPGMIVLDLMMPTMDGYALLDVLTRDPGLSKIPVIVMSAQPSRVRRSPNVVSVMRKPLSLDALVQTISTHMTGR